MTQKNKQGLGLYWPIYWSWTRIEGGRRMHLPLLATLLGVLSYCGMFTLPIWVWGLLLINSTYLTRVGNTNYIVVGCILLECKIYLAPPPLLPEITSEDVLEKHKSKLNNYMKYREKGDLISASKKVKISSKAVKQLALEMGYVVEENTIFHK